ncbi:MAG: DUF2277 domain-containing protein [Candidatus Saccharimonadales bacterium]
MCRNIKKLYNFEPHATSDEVNAAALQYVRKISGFQKSSVANEAAFNHAIHEVAHATHHLLEELVTQAAPRNRDIENTKARARSLQRFGQ